MKNGHVYDMWVLAYGITQTSYTYTLGEKGFNKGCV